MTLPQFTFVNKTKFMAGKLALEQLPSELLQRQCRTVLIVTDARSVKKGAVKTLVGAFGRCDTKLKLLVYDKTREPLDQAQVADVVRIFRETTSDALIALGSKTVMDLTRLANIDISLGIQDPGKIRNTREEWEAMKPLFAIPTSADTETSLSTPKGGWGDLDWKTVNAFMPSGVILDPRSMIPRSAKSTAEAGLSALLHAVEGAIGPCGNPVSQSYAFAALGLLNGHLIASVKSTSDKINHLHVTSACHLADAAFSNTTSGLGVSFIRALSTISGLDAHVSTAMLLPALMKKRMETKAQDVARLLWALEGAEVYARTPAWNRAQAAVDSVASLIGDLGKAGNIVTRLDASGLINGNMDEVLKHVAEDGENIQPDEVKMMLAS